MDEKQQEPQAPPQAPSPLVTEPKITIGYNEGGQMCIEMAGGVSPFQAYALLVAMSNTVLGMINFDRPSRIARPNGPLPPDMFDPNLRRH